MLWKDLFGGKSEARMDQNSWAQFYNNFFSFGGNTYPLTGMHPLGSKVEAAPNDFTGYANQVYKSCGPVFAAAVFRMSIFSQVTFCYQRYNKGRAGDRWGNADLGLLENPWPHGVTADLLSRAMQDTDLAGTFYAVKEGAGTRAKPYRVRRMRPDWVDVVLTKPAAEALDSDIAGHVFKPNNTTDPDKWEVFPVDGSNGTVVSWSPIPDPEAQYRGMSWMTPVLSEIMADKQASRHKLKFFENAATPSLAVSLSETVTDEQFTKFMNAMNRSKAGVDHAYETLYLGGGADVRVIGANLQQMDFINTQGHGETRILSAAGVHPTLVGLAEHMHGTPLNAGNFPAAKNRFADGTMRPLWASFCASMAPLVNVPGGSRLWYEDRDIQFLRQDRKELSELLQTDAATLSSLIQSGFTPDSACAFLQSDGDSAVLEHTGRYSVQLMPPGTDGTFVGDANTPDPSDTGGQGKGKTPKFTQGTPQKPGGSKPDPAQGGKQ